jgi:hypothetical protein
VAAEGTRVNVTLDAEYGEKLRRMAERAYVQEGTMARSLLSRAIDEADIDPESMVDLLGRIPGAVERLERAREQLARGEVVELEDL